MGDIQHKIKEIAERYGLAYDPDQQNTQVEQQDGNIKEIVDKDWKDLFKSEE
ncbi:hypothetical protein [Paenibacillus sp. USHLN196]|uniref:hypothetical protein n=1 Tax=Paenibacillus sp. USHLN196 TaxID=3081291 RepID=UPI0030181B82